MKYLMYCDGACQPNPGRGAVGIVCYIDNPRSTVFEISQFVGDHVTNNFAEYMSAIIGLEAALSKGIQELWVCMDSQLVVKQCRKEWRVKEPSLIPLNTKVLELMKQFKSITFQHVGRSENTEADKLSKLGLL